MDPITLIVTALATGAAAGLKPTAERAIKDAYDGLKALIQRKYDRVSVDMLESDPASESRQAIVKEDLDKTDAAQDQELLAQAQATIQAIEANAPEAAAAVGVSLEDLKVAGSVNIEDIIASGSGVNVRGADVGGDFTIRGVRAGQSGEADPNG